MNKIVDWRKWPLIVKLWRARRKILKTFVWILSKNSVSGSLHFPLIFTFSQSMYLVFFFSFFWLNVLYLCTFSSFHFLFNTYEIPGIFCILQQTIPQKQPYILVGRRAKILQLVFMVHLLPIEEIFIFFKDLPRWGYNFLWWDLFQTVQTDGGHFHFIHKE